MNDRLRIWSICLFSSSIEQAINIITLFILGIFFTMNKGMKTLFITMIHFWITKDWFNLLIYYTEWKNGKNWELKMRHCWNYFFSSINNGCFPDFFSSFIFTIIIFIINIEYAFFNLYLVFPLNALKTRHSCKDRGECSSNIYIIYLMFHIFKTCINSS